MSEEQHARVRRRTRNPLIWLFRYINDWARSNPETSQFWGSIISSAITLLALLITVFFSWKALSESQKQNNNAKQQLSLAVNQFKSSQKQKSEDSIANAKKDTIANNRFILDTVKQGQRERRQEHRNQLQDAANKQQYELNKSQLNAIQVQAQIAKDQFKQQQLQYKQQLYEQRPVFTIDSAIVNKVNSVKSTIKFSFSNIGFRPSHIDSVIYAYYNPTNLCFEVASFHSNLDLLPQKGSIITLPINVYNDCLYNGLNIYYLLIYYNDKLDAMSKIESIFFRYEEAKPHQFRWSHFEGLPKQDFIKRLKKSKIFTVE